jgi:hypothetical protein
MTATRKGINASRLKTIYTRQESPGWSADYVPAILATPQEAPSISRAFVLTPEKLECREVHLLSTPERNAALLGLYHPDVVGLQEQRMLSPEPCPHPLWTFPRMDRTGLPALRGLIDVADRLGYLKLLSRVNVENTNDPCGFASVIFPWIGDLLWAIRTAVGEVFNINWTVKSSYADFKRASLKGNKTGDVTRGLARHEIEKTYYEDARIKTVQVADEAIDSHVAANLRQLFLHHRRPLGLTTEQRAEILHKFHSALEAGVPPVEVILQYSDRRKFTVHQTRSCFYQAVWNRELRIDLFHPILINLPQRAEERDVLDVYADWFGRN